MIAHASSSVKRTVPDASRSDRSLASSTQLANADETVSVLARHRRRCDGCAEAGGVTPRHPAYLSPYEVQ